MKQHYDIYGMGNALVDTEFRLEDHELEKLGIQKGMMTLIDHERLLELIHQLKHVQCNRASGGSAANTIITSQLLGNKTFYSCKVANDAAGDLFLTELLAQEVATNLTYENREAGITGECLVKITPDSERTMCTYLGATNTYSDKEMNLDALKNSKYLYIEGYLSAQPTATKTAIHAKHLAETHGVKTSITLSDPTIVNYFKNNFLTIIGHGVDLIFCNEQEALMFCETEDLEIAKNTLKKYAKTYAITLGAHGVCVFDGKTTATVPSTKVKVINTVGAGDTFAGAFLYALSKNYDYVQAAILANLAAAQVVTKLGPRLDAEEVALVMGKFKKEII